MAYKILAAAFSRHPVGHFVIDEFLPSAFAEQLSSEFIPYDYPNWQKKGIEDKKTCSQWNLFPPPTYL